MPETNSMPTWPGWETVRLIGRGSFGAVYEIRREVLGETEKAALKVISIPQSSSDIDELYGEGYDDESITSTFQEHLKSIVAEYTLMRRLNGHSNVVSCDDVRYVQHDDGLGWDIFIKMELLTQLPKSLGDSISDPQVVRIGSDICRALMLCKRYNIIHRDIKPANIFASDNGDYKLGDFGIAKTVEKTSGGTKIGTYEYMAPEVYHDQPYGSAADIYSLGLVLYWLLNERRTPFLKRPPALPTNSDKEQARRRRFSGEPIPAPAHGSEELQRIVLKACAYDPKDRYPSAEDMLADLEALDGQERNRGSEATAGSYGEWAGEDARTEGGHFRDTEDEATIGAFGSDKVDGEATVSIFSKKPSAKPENNPAAPKPQEKKPEPDPPTKAPSPTLPAEPGKKKRAVWPWGLVALAVLGILVFGSRGSKPNSSSSAGKVTATAAPTAAPTTAPTKAPSDYISELDGAMSSERIILAGRTTTNPFVLDSTVYNCKKMTMNLKINSYSGSPFGWWALYVRKTDGQWYKIQDYKVDSSFVNDTVSIEVTFSSPTTFDAIAHAAKFDSTYSVSFSRWYTDVYTS